MQNKEAATKRSISHAPVNDHELYDLKDDALVLLRSLGKIYVNALNQAGRSILMFWRDQHMITEQQRIEMQKIMNQVMRKRPHLRHKWRVNGTHDVCCEIQRRRPKH